VSAHRGAPIRPRYGRLGALGASLAVTVIAVLGGAGALPTASGGAADHEAQPTAAIGTAADDTTDTKSSAELTAGGSSADRTEAESDPRLDTTLPADSGTGKRIVFSQSRQRVWLVSGGKHVQRTYLASGSVTDNLDPGTYSVYSRSEQAYGIDDSGTMKYFVRFTQGDTGAAIGFHDIPIDDGHLVQSRAQLGTPQSHGCIRQNRPDAIALWDFAPLGTTVVVTA